jgi:lipoate synthase
VRPSVTSAHWSLRLAKELIRTITKTGLMVGLGETRDELLGVPD